MTEQTTANERRAARERSLERSLREGPADERGYRAEAIDLGTDAHAEPLRADPSSVRFGRRSPGALSGFLSLDAIALVLVVVVAGLLLFARPRQDGSGGPQTPTVPASASPVPVPDLTETFVSTRNGFSVRYPAGWSIKAATASWLPNTFLPIGSPALDELKIQGGARLVGASQPLGAGQTEASWLAAFGQEYYLRRCSGDRAAWPRVMVDGRSGYLDLNACPLPADESLSTPDIAFDAIVFAGGRAYRIGLDGAVDLGDFERVMATVRLDPTSAADPVASP